MTTIMTNQIQFDYKNFLQAIKNRVVSARVNFSRQANRETNSLYWFIGQTIDENQKKHEWGKSVVENLSRDLKESLPDITFDFSKRNLRDMKKFYLKYKNNEKLRHSVAEIDWGSNLLIMNKVKDEAAREYYIQATTKMGWTRSVLELQVSSQAYEIQHFTDRFIECYVLKEKYPNTIEGIEKELKKKFESCYTYLDKKFMSELEDSDKVNSCFWEFFVLIHILDNQNDNQKIKVSHADSGPDWKVIINDKTCIYIEAVCAQLPNSNKNCCGFNNLRKCKNELENNQKTVADTNTFDECRSRITSCVTDKLKKHKKFMENKKAGYILCVSYGSIPPHISCSLDYALRALIPIGPIINKIDPKNNHIVDSYLKNEDQFLKPSTGSMIRTDIFDNDDNKWVSAILVSALPPPDLLGSAYPDRKNKNDFMLILNPKASYPLEKDLFQCWKVVKYNQCEVSICEYTSQNRDN